MALNVDQVELQPSVDPRHGITPHVEPLEPTVSILPQYGEGESLQQSSQQRNISSPPVTRVVFAPCLQGYISFRFTIVIQLEYGHFDTESVIFKIIYIVHDFLCLITYL